MKKKGDSDQMALAGTEEAEILGRLNDKVEKAITTINELRRERDALKGKVEAVEARLREHEETSARAATLQQDCERFQDERSEIRTRIETILSSLEALEEDAAAPEGQ